MTLDEALASDPTELRWQCAHESATGLDVLEIARSGLVLLPGEFVVPRIVFHEWMYRSAERLLRAHVGFGHLEDHESDWLSQGVALVATIGDPTEHDFEEIRVLTLMTIASCNTFGAIRFSAREMGKVYAWVSDALSWAAKRYTGDRYCPHEPVTLNHDLVELHGQLAEFRNDDVADARSRERDSQMTSLLAAWKAKR